MSASDLIKNQELSQTEQDILVQLYSNPSVKKHLQIMALNDTIELLSLSAGGRSDRDLAMAHENIRGRLSTINTLLSIGSQESQSNASKENQS